MTAHNGASSSATDSDGCSCAVVDAVRVVLTVATVVCTHDHCTAALAEAML
jgi:hypothetical protein